MDSPEADISERDDDEKGKTDAESPGKAINIEQKSHIAANKSEDDHDRTSKDSPLDSQNAESHDNAINIEQKSHIAADKTEDVQDRTSIEASLDTESPGSAENMERKSNIAEDKTEDVQDRTSIEAPLESEDTESPGSAENMERKSNIAEDKTEDVQDRTSIEAPLEYEDTESPGSAENMERKSNIAEDKTEDVQDRTSIEAPLESEGAEFPVSAKNMEQKSKIAGDKTEGVQDSTPTEVPLEYQGAQPAVCAKDIEQQSFITGHETEDDQDSTREDQLEIQDAKYPACATNMEQQSQIAEDKAEDVQDSTTKEAQLDTLMTQDYVCFGQLTRTKQGCQMNTKEKARTSYIQELVISLSLSKYFPEKITLQDVRAMQSNNVPLTKANLPWLLLMKLIMVNLNAREEDLVKLTDECDDEDFDLNPMDLFLVTYLACNPILQQEIIQKMIKCRHAIPFIYRDLNNKLRWSKLSMKKILVPENTDRGMNTVDALNHKGKIVSFVKVGDISVSKSKLLNNVLSENSYSTFFNTDCPLGNTERLVASGTIEASWFLPKENSSGLFNETLMFLNLRGDAMEYHDEFRKLVQISNVIVVFTNENHMNGATLQEKLSDVSSETSVMYALETNYKKREFAEKIRKRLSTQRKLFCSLGSSKNVRSNSDVAKELRKMLADVLQTMTGVRLVDNLHVLEEKDNCDLIEVENLAKDFKSVLEKYPKIGRSEFVPLQGKLWRDYGSAHKKHCKSKSNDEKDQFEKETINIRSEQFKRLEDGIHPLMKLFCRHIEKLCQMRQTEFSIYIEWIMSYIDDRSREILPEKVEKYNMCWKNMKLAKEKQEHNEKKTKEHKENEYETLRKELLKSEDELIAASFGLEHLIRELGQMYEATSRAKSRFNRTLFVDFACELLQYGYPFEILDGDTAMVPLIWVKAVVQRLVEVIGDEKVLSLSVLGIQSSGKSTLLNAMFGLKFPVSAGRCTRGVYIQLVKVEKKCFPFSYVLVIDTEGLRAPELEHQSHCHDNELATFVIGLGNITIINIKGENTSELEDILQIAVHAFLRLKMANSNLNRKHTCIFTHQNVSAANARTANVHGRQKMIDKLDKMTLEAATQEGLKGITTFKQVLNLDPDSHVFYFSDLFMGDPPMAPVNIGYSTKVNEVRKCLINDIAEKKGMFLTLSQTVNRIEDLWKGILTEDFVFSFRNSLEVKAYNMMETEYFKIKSSVNEVISKHIREDVRNKLISCEDGQQLDKLANEMESSLFDLIAKQEEETVNKWKEYVDNSSLREIVEQWRENRNNTLKEHIMNIKSEVTKSIRKIKKECSANLVRTKGHKDHKRDIKEQAMKLAKRHQGKKLSSAELDKLFEEMWSKWLKVIGDETPVDNTSVKNEVNKILFERLHNESHLVRKEYDASIKRLSDKFFSHMKQLTESFSYDNITVDDICYAPLSKNLAEKIYNKGAEMLSPTKFEKIVKHVETELNVWFLSIDEFMRKIEKADGVRFDISYVLEIFNQLTDYIETNNKEFGKSKTFSITNKFKVKLAVFIARYITEVFTRLDETYQRKHGIEAQMSIYKIDIKQQFIGIVEEESETVTLAKRLGISLEQLCIKDFEKSLPPWVDTKMRERFGTKAHLILEMMRNLAANDEFSEYIKFIKQPKEFAIKWVTQLAENELLSTKDKKTSRYSSFIETQANINQQKILEFLEDACNATNSYANDAKLTFWITTFREKLKDTFEVLPDTFHYIEDYKMVKDYVSVSDNLRNQLDSKCIKSSLDKHFAVEDGKFKPWNENPFYDFIRDFWGCDEKCPFCREICSITDSKHNETHRCVQHRPAAVNGLQNAKTEIMWHTTCYESVSSNDTFSHNFCVQASKCSCKDKSKELENEYHPYRQYANYFPEWDIDPRSGREASTFWKWFVYRFRYELVKHYGYKMSESIDMWKDITKDEAIQSLKSYF